VCKIVVVTVIN